MPNFRGGWALAIWVQAREIKAQGSCGPIFWPLRGGPDRQVDARELTAHVAVNLSPFAFARKVKLGEFQFFVGV